MTTVLDLKPNVVPSADDFGRDFFFRVPHPRLAWSILEVLVRPANGLWQYAYGYNFSASGMGTPFTGKAPSRETAGRAGMLRLRDALKRFTGEGKPDGRDGDQIEAAKYLARIQELLHPTQPELFDLSWKGGAA